MAAADTIHMTITVACTKTMKKPTPPSALVLDLDLVSFSFWHPSSFWLSLSLSFTQERFRLAFSDLNRVPLCHDPTPAGP